MRLHRHHVYKVIPDGQTSTTAWLPHGRQVAAPLFRSLTDVRYGRHPEFEGERASAIQMASSPIYGSKNPTTKPNEGHVGARSET